MDRRISPEHHTTRTCRRCTGYGIISQYRRVNGGECFRCHGRGLEDVYTPKTRAELETETAELARADAYALELRRHRGNPFAALLAVS